MDLKPKSFEKKHECNLIEVVYAFFDHAMIVNLRFKSKEISGDLVKIMLDKLNSAIELKRKIRIFVDARSVEKPTFAGLMGMLELSQKLDAKGRDYVTYVEIVCTPDAKTVMDMVMKIKKPTATTTLSIDRAEGWQRIVNSS
jgi:hypothetical protein